MVAADDIFLVALLVVVVVVVVVDDDAWGLAQTFRKGRVLLMPVGVGPLPILIPVWKRERDPCIEWADGVMKN